MDEKQANRYLRREFRVIGWLLVAYYGILNVMAMAALFSEAFRQCLEQLSKGELFTNPDMQAIMGNGWGYVATVAIGLLSLFCWKEERFWKESVLAFHGRMTAGIFMVLASLLLVFLDKGASEVSTRFGLNQDYSEIVTGIILFFLIGCEFFMNYQIHINKSRLPARWRKEAVADKKEVQ